MSWRTYFCGKVRCRACGRYFLPEALIDGDCPDCVQNPLVAMFRKEREAAA